MYLPIDFKTHAALGRCRRLQFVDSLDCPFQSDVRSGAPRRSCPASAGHRTRFTKQTIRVSVVACRCPTSPRNGRFQGAVRRTDPLVPPAPSRCAMRAQELSGVRPHRCRRSVQAWHGRAARRLASLAGLDLRWWDLGGARCGLRRSTALEGEVGGEVGGIRPEIGARRRACSSRRAMALIGPAWRRMGRCGGRGSPSGFHISRDLCLASWREVARNGRDRHVRDAG